VSLGLGIWRRKVPAGFLGALVAIAGCEGPQGLVY